MAMFVSTSHGAPASFADHAKRLIQGTGPAAAGLFAAMLRAYRNRQLLMQMSGMSDHELADIGLRRGDLADAALVAADRDASELLAARARDQHLWGRH